MTCSTSSRSRSSTGVKMRGSSPLKSWRNTEKTTFRCSSCWTPTCRIRAVKRLRSITFLTWIWSWKWISIWVKKASRSMSIKLIHLKEFNLFQTSKTLKTKCKICPHTPLPTLTTQSSSHSPKNPKSANPKSPWIQQAQLWSTSAQGSSHLTSPNFPAITQPQIPQSCMVRAPLCPKHSSTSTAWNTPTRQWKNACKRGSWRVRIKWLLFRSVLILRLSMPIQWLSQKTIVLSEGAMSFLMKAWPIFEI